MTLLGRAAAALQGAGIALEGEDRAELIAEVEQLLVELPPWAVKLWRRVLED